MKIVVGAVGTFEIRGVDRVENHRDATNKGNS